MSILSTLVRLMVFMAALQFFTPIFADEKPVTPDSCSLSLGSAAEVSMSTPVGRERGKRILRLMVGAGVVTAASAALVLKSPAALAYLGVVGCVSCLSGVASASEAAILSVDRQEIERQAEAGDRSAQRLLVILDDLDSYIPTLVVVNNLVNTPGAIAMGAMGEGLVGGFWSTMVSTLAIMFYGEDLSKGVGVQKSQAIAKLAAVALPVIRRGVSPLIWVMNGNSRFMRAVITDMTLGRLGFDQPEAAGRRAQLLNYLEYVHNIGAINRQEHRFLVSILRFRDKKMEELVEFDREIKYLRVGQSLDEALDKISTLNFTRYPVLGDNDELVGIVTKRDLEQGLRDTRHADLKVREFMSTSVTSVRKSDSAVDTWNRLVHGNSRMAVVVDDHFRPMGLITLEEIVEDMIGDEFFNDQSDSPEEIERDFDRERIKIPGVRQSQHLARIEAWEREIEQLNNPQLYDRLSGTRVSRAAQIESLRAKIDDANRVYYSLSPEQKIEVFEAVWSLFVYESEAIEFLPEDSREQGHRRIARRIRNSSPRIFETIHARVELRYHELSQTNPNLAWIREELIREFGNGFFDKELSEGQRERLKDLYYRETPSE